MCCNGLLFLEMTEDPAPFFPPTRYDGPSYVLFADWYVGAVIRHRHPEILNDAFLLLCSFVLNVIRPCFACGAVAMISVVQLVNTTRKFKSA